MTKKYFVIMANDFPDSIVHGTEAFAEATAAARKKTYVNRNCGYAPEAEGPHAEKARAQLADRMYFRARQVEIIREGKVKK